MAGLQAGYLGITHAFQVVYADGVVLYPRLYAAGNVQLVGVYLGFQSVLPPGFQNALGFRYFEEAFLAEYVYIYSASPSPATRGSISLMIRLMYSSLFSLYSTGHA